MRVHLIAPIAALLLAHAPAADAAVDTVQYECTTKATGEKQNIKVDVELTVPASAGAGQNLTIGWQGTYADGTELLAPSDVQGTLKLYAYAGISGIPSLTSATGVGQLGTVTPGAAIPLPTTTVNLTTTPPNDGEGTVHAAAINFGPTPQSPVIECEVQNKAALTEYPLTVGAGGSSTSPSSTPSSSPTETDDEDEDTPTTTPDATESESPTETSTPSGGAETGGGGEAGPDGRALMLVGSVLLLSSATGLALRRRARRPA